MTEFEKEVEKRRKQINKAQEKVDQKREDLKVFLKDCPHDKIEEKSSYFPGSYNDKAYTTKWNQCALCQARSESITVEHIYYG